MKKTILAGVAIAFLSSCSFLDEEPHVICSDTFYRTMDDVQSGLAGVYGPMGLETFYGNYYSMFISNVDDLCYFNRSTADQKTAIYRHDSGSTEVYQVWTAIYRGIRNANAFMDAIVDTDFDKDGAYYAEARFLRAYYHFLLGQAWGNVPVRKEACKEHSDTPCAATQQYEVLKWCAEEMEACLPDMPDDISLQPSRVTVDVAHGILARVYLFMAGESVAGGDRKELYGKAMENALHVISTGRYELNPSYQDIFINMVRDSYDTQYHESMWEVEFSGDRSGSQLWSNGRIGDVIGLRSSGREDFLSFSCNYSYAQYDGTLMLWNLYWSTDRTDDENMLPAVTDRRQIWNMPPYNYEGRTSAPLYVASKEKTPYVYRNVSTFDDPMTARAIRNCGKWRREVQYEGVKDNMSIYTAVNFPLLRYADVLLMYAEAYNEYYGIPDESAYNAVKDVRDRAGIKTRDIKEYDGESFRELVRNERGRELCFESLRKYDLIRWGTFVEAMHSYGYYTLDEEWNFNNKYIYAAAIGAAVSEKHILMPIPAIELGVNDELVQNPLW
ncbi:MAG: RagB/SusD family nutrient uptake outer membrane protein [Bacteroidales bacterium]|nr:RagB/SusD family nutrient uptake outer membrane protein [Bacteroidales bacterium]